jgi:hypothetical protein
MTAAGFQKNWQSHLLICPRVMKTNAVPSPLPKLLPAPEPNFSNYIEIEGFETAIPPHEVDATNQRSFVLEQRSTSFQSTPFLNISQEFILVFTLS